MMEIIPTTVQMFAHPISVPNAKGFPLSLSVSTLRRGRGGEGGGGSGGKNPRRCGALTETGPPRVSKAQESTHSSGKSPKSSLRCSSDFLALMRSA